MRFLTIAFAVMVAGCTSPTLDASTYTLEVAGAPGTATGPFTFHLEVEGDVDSTSDHIGAHYWNTTVADPDAAFGQALSCAHQAGDVPGHFDVTCDLDNGKWYMRGHLRIVDGEATNNYWSNEFVVEVAREPAA